MSQSEAVRYLDGSRTSGHECVQRYKANGEAAFRVQALCAVMAARRQRRFHG